MITVEEVRETARRLQPIQQIQLIQELLHRLQKDYPNPLEEVTQNNTPHVVPISNLNDLAADFWSENDLIDDIGSLIAKEHGA
ncbi:MAG: hypothetical protein HGA19_05895 [Oscillochloris sp.]|nr:hypothetical protein [Oscillochloris sp.]